MPHHAGRAADGLRFREPYGSGTPTSPERKMMRTDTNSGKRKGTFSSMGSRSDQRLLFYWMIPQLG
jgi:hypothetical protein